MEANCLAVWKIGDLQAVDIYQYTISFMFEDKTKHQTWLLILNILRQISLNFQYYWKNMKLLSMGGGILFLLYNYKKEVGTESFPEFVYFVRALLWTVNHINYMFMHNKAEK